MAFSGVLLGLGGLIPFLATTTALWWFGDERYLQVGLLYGACILSFLGGIQWGFALPSKQGGAMHLYWSVIPALIGWGATLAPPFAGPWILAAGVFAAWLYERQAALAARLPDWYRALRHLLTLVVVICMIANGIWVELRW